jgi:hypothetical protein
MLSPSLSLAALIAAVRGALVVSCEKGWVGLLRLLLFFLLSTLCSPPPPPFLPSPPSESSRGPWDGHSVVVRGHKRYGWWWWWLNKRVAGDVAMRVTHSSQRWLDFPCSVSKVVVHGRGLLALCIACWAVETEKRNYPIKGG